MRVCVCERESEKERERERERERPLERQILFATFFVEICKAKVSVVVCREAEKEELVFVSFASTAAVAAAGK